MAAKARSPLAAEDYVARQQQLLRRREHPNGKSRERLREGRCSVAAELVHAQDDRPVAVAWFKDLDDPRCETPVIPDQDADAGATIGSTVEVQYVSTGRHVTYRLTAAASFAGDRVVSAPVGRAVIGRRAGDVVSAHLPGGRVEEMRIVAVTPGFRPRRRERHRATDGRRYAVARASGARAAMEGRQPIG